MKNLLICLTLFVCLSFVYAGENSRENISLSASEASEDVFAVQISSLSPAHNSTTVSAAVGSLVINTVEALTWDGVGLPTIILHKSTGPSTSTQIKQFFFNNSNDIDFQANRIEIKGIPRLEYDQSYFLTFEAVSVFKDANGDFITLDIDVRQWLFTVESNAAPTDISLSPSSITENNSLNATVGALTSTDPNIGDSFTYSLVTGTGSTDNTSFNISGSSLRATFGFNYESKSSYSIRVRSTDSGGLFTEKELTVNVLNQNESPQSIALDPRNIDENNEVNAVIGTLSTTDLDLSDTYTYILVSGTGSTDNASFNISGNSLRASAAFDYEAKNSYTVRVRSTDQGGLFVETAFTISINDVTEGGGNSAPTNITLSASNINENNAVNAVIGTLSSTDEDAGGTFTYSLVSGTGSTDNNSFNISGNSLRASAVFDYETKNSFSIRIRTTDDGGLTFEKVFAVSVSDVIEEEPDATPPSVTNFSPADDAIDVAVNGLLVVTFDESIQFDGDDQAVIIAKGTYEGFTHFLGSDDSQMTIQGNTLTIDLDFNLDYETTYWVWMKGVTDVAGNYYQTSAATAWSFTTMSEPVGNSAPTNIFLSASSVNENNSVNAVIGTLSSTDPDVGDTFTYSLVSGTGSTDNNSFNISGNSLRASAVFDYETKNSFSIRIRSTDDGGLTFEKVFAVSVSDVIEEEPDATPPSVTNFSPADDAIDVAVNGLLVVNFSEPIQFDGDDQAVIISKGTNTSFTHFLASDDAQMSIEGNVLTIDLSFNLDYETTYWVWIKSVTDLAGNYYPNSAATAWSFTTMSEPDLQAPQIVSFNPADNATGIAMDADLTVTFDEPIVAGTGAISVRKVSDNSIVLNGRPSFETQLFTINGSDLTIHLANYNTNAPEGDVTYFVQIENGAVTDESANAFASGFTDNITWNFTTTKLDQTISFGTLSAKTYGDANFSLTANASSGLSVTYVSSNQEVATIQGNVVMIIGAGSTTITASQSGNTTYGAATPVQQILVVNKANQTITFETITNKTIGQSFDLVFSASSGLIVDLAVEGPATLEGSTLTTTGLGTVTVTANQSGNADFNAATEVERTFEVTEVLGLDETAGLRIYPNPVSTQLHIEAIDRLSVRVLSLSGKLVWQGDANQNVDVSSLEQGMYLVEASDGKTTQVYKIFKSN